MRGEIIMLTHVGKEMERETRLELATLCLGSRCSTTELLPLERYNFIPKS